jgi:hypothetical protein
MQEALLFAKQDNDISQASDSLGHPGVGKSLLIINVESDFPPQISGFKWDIDDYYNKSPLIIYVSFG